MTTKQPTPKDPTAQLTAIEGRQRHCLAKAPLAGILRTLLGTDVPALIGEVRSLRARIAAADQLHRPHAHNGICDSRPWAPCDADDACEYDADPWPCPTHTALHPEDSRG